MSDGGKEFKGSSLELIKLAAQYKKLDAKRTSGLTPAEEKLYQEIVKKLSRKLDPNTQDELQSNRKALRVKSNQQIRMSSGRDFKKVYMENISGGGIYVATNDFLPVGSDIQLQFKMDQENFEFQLEGRVAWVNPKPLPSLPAGMGIQFKGSGSEHDRFIRKLIHGELDKSLARELQKSKSPSKENK